MLAGEQVDRESLGLEQPEQLRHPQSWQPRQVFHKSFKALIERDSSDRRICIGETNNILLAMTMTCGILEKLVRIQVDKQLFASVEQSSKHIRDLDVVFLRRVLQPET